MVTSWFCLWSRREGLLKASHTVRHPIVIMIFLNSAYQTPPISDLVVPLTEQDLWCQILGRSTKRVGEFAFREIDFGESEIGDLDMPIGCKEDVLWFQVAVDDLLLVDILQCEHQLGTVELGLVLAETERSSQVEEQLSADHEIRDEVQLGLGLEGEVQLHNKGMLNILQDDPLVLGVRLLVALLDHVLPQDLHRVELVVLSVID